MASTGVPTLDFVFFPNLAKFFQVSTDMISMPYQLRFRFCAQIGMFSTDMVCGGCVHGAGVPPPIGQRAQRRTGCSRISGIPRRGGRVREDSPPEARARPGLFRFSDALLWTCDFSLDHSDQSNQSSSRGGEPRAGRAAALRPRDRGYVAFASWGCTPTRTQRDSRSAGAPATPAGRDAAATPTLLAQGRGRSGRPGRPGGRRPADGRAVARPTLAHVRLLGA